MLTQVKPSKPRASQAASRLMGLPPETRLTILSYLLVCDKPISFRETYETFFRGPKRDDKGRFVKRIQRKEVRGYKLSPSILATCQTLFEEGLPMLYHLNTLEIDIFTSLTSYNPQNLSLSTLQLVPRGQFDTREVHVDMLSFDGKSIMRYGTGNKWLQEDDFLNVARRFVNFLIKVDYNPNVLHLAQLRALIRRTSNVFWQQSNIRLIVAWGLPNSSQLANNLGPQHLRTIKAFMPLRCRQFEVVGITDPDAQSVAKVVTGDSVIVNLDQLFPLVGRMIEILVDNTPFERQKPALLTLLTKLIDAVADFDVPTFLQARHHVMLTWDFIARQTRLLLDDLKPCDDKLRVSMCRLHVSEGSFGFKVLEEADRDKSEVQRLAKLYDFKPDYDYDRLPEGLKVILKCKARKRK